MQLLLRGLLAGAFATGVAATLVWINASTGPLPELDLVAMLARVMGESRSAAWIGFAVIGVLGCGTSLAVLAGEDGSAPATVAALLCGVGWLATMMGLLPMAGHAPFGTGIAPAVPMLVALWYLLFGVALAGAWHGLGLLAAWHASLDATRAARMAGDAHAKRAAAAPAAAPRPADTPVAAWAHSSPSDPLPSDPLPADPLPSDPSPSGRFHSDPSHAAASHATRSRSDPARAAARQAAPLHLRLWHAMHAAVTAAAAAVQRQLAVHGLARERRMRAQGAKG